MTFSINVRENQRANKNGQPRKIVITGHTRHMTKAYKAKITTQKTKTIEQHEPTLKTWGELMRSCKASNTCVS